MWRSGSITNCGQHIHTHNAHCSVVSLAASSTHTHTHTHTHTLLRGVAGCKQHTHTPVCTHAWHSALGSVHVGAHTHARLTALRHTHTCQTHGSRTCSSWSQPVISSINCLVVWSRVHTCSLYCFRDTYILTPAVHIHNRMKHITLTWSLLTQAKRERNHFRS